MSKLPAVTIGAEFIPALPSSARTRGGVIFDPTADKWAYRDGIKNVSLDFSFTARLSDGLIISLKAVLLWYAERCSPSHLQNMHSHFVRFVRFLASTSKEQIVAVKSHDLLNYKAHLPKTNEWYLGTLSGLLKKWHRLGMPGVTDEAMSLLRELRIKGNAKGVAVRTMDPVNGAYTSLEIEAIQSELNAEYADGSVDEGLYLLAWLFMALGQRPAQYAALKVCDISAPATAEGHVTYTLSVPRAKQRDTNPRQELKDRPLVSQLGKPIYEYAIRIRSQFSGLLDDPDQAPMFPQMSSVELAPGFEYHHTSGTLARALQTTLNSLRVYSERTKKPLHITATRFRRTFGTRAGQEGHSPLVIAEMLDHSDTQNVGVYVEAVPEIAARIDRAMAMELAPVARAFKGILIKGDAEATRSGDPSSHIVDLRIDRSMSPMGSCGQYSFCGFAAPIACYTCSNFEPWIDGPHEAVLEHLLARREQLRGAADERMASINDRTILAVSQVIQMCEEMQGKGAGKNG